ncbi:MAG: hypothetical protein AB7F19_07815 [Candidatus Babeliales bacterium]
MTKFNDHSPDEPNYFPKQVELVWHNYKGQKNLVLVDKLSINDKQLFICGGFPDSNIAILIKHAYNTFFEREKLIRELIGTISDLKVSGQWKSDTVSAIDFIIESAKAILADEKQ